MKVSEIYSFTAESLNSSVPIKWVKESDREVGYFELAETEYGVVFEYGTFPVLGKTITFANVTFFTLVDGREDYSLQLTGSYAGRVFATVISAIREKITSHNLHALLLGAVGNEVKRMTTYNAIAQRYAKEFGTVVRNIPTPSGQLTIVLQRSAFGDDFDKFVEFAKKIDLNK